MTLRNYPFSRQHRAHFSEDIYACVLWRYVAVHIWRVKELFVPGIVASTIKLYLFHSAWHISKQWQYRIEKQALSAYINSSPVNINKRCVLSRYDYIWENFNWKTYDYNDDDDDDDNDDSDDDDNDDEDMNQKIVMVTNWWIWMMANSIEIYLYYRITHTCVLYWALGQ